MSKQIQLVTPEGVPLDLALGDLAERFMALCIDLGIIALAVLVFALVGALVGATVGEPMVLVFLAVFLLRHGYFAFFETHWHGSTPGKRLFQLRVISRDARGLTTEAVLARNLMRDIELFLPLFAIASPDLLVGRMPGWLAFPATFWIVLMGVFPLLSKERTRMGDLVGGTVVIKAPRSVLLEDQAGRLRDDGGIHFTKGQLGHYGEHELETLAQLLRDVDELRAERAALRVVSRTIARKVGYAGVEPTERPEAFLRAFYKAQRAELEEKLLYGKRVASKFERE